MKKLILSLLIVAPFTNQVACAASGWTPISAADAERDAIMSKIKAIRAHYYSVKCHLAGMGGAGSSAYKAQDAACQKDIFNLLKSIGSPVSYQILKEMCSTGELPATFLTMA